MCSSCPEAAQCRNLVSIPVEIWNYYSFLNACDDVGQGDLYVRDDHGGVFVAVASPLDMSADDR